MSDTSTSVSSCFIQVHYKVLERSQLMRLWYLETSHLLPVGPGYIQLGGGRGRGRGRKLFLVMYWEVENKKPLQHGVGSYISSGIWGSDMFYWFLLSLKVIAPPPPPLSLRPISQLILPTICNVQEKKATNV